MIIDFHTHAFPDKLAGRAVEKLAKLSSFVPQTDGTVKNLLEKMDTCGIDISVICNIATNARQESNVNSFAIEVLKSNPRLLPLGSLHPESQILESEIKRIVAAGIPGIKLHPDYVHRDIDSHDFDKIFDICIQNGLFVIIHAGVDVYSLDHVHATPEMILNVMSRFPDLKLIAAHFGANLMWNEVEEKLAGKDLWIDTSLAYIENMEPKLAERIILKHDSDKILFGSDLPWCPSDRNVEYIQNLSIPEDMKDKIFEKNARYLLHM